MSQKKVDEKYILNIKIYFFDSIQTINDYKYFKYLIKTVIKYIIKNNITWLYSEINIENIVEL